MRHRPLNELRKELDCLLNVVVDYMLELHGPNLMPVDVERAVWGSINGMPLDPLEAGVPSREEVKPVIPPVVTTSSL